MQASATAIGWVGVHGKEAAKKAAKEYALPRQNEQFLQELQGKSTLANMNIWTDKEATSLAPYLNMEWQNGLRFGRRLKTKFHLECHHLRCSTSRMENVRDSTCECCKSEEIETVQRTKRHCPAFAKERNGFIERACAVQPFTYHLRP